MKEKVIMYGSYPRDNQAVTHNVELTPVDEAGRIFHYLVEKDKFGTEYDLIGMVVKIEQEDKAVYLECNHVRRKNMEAPSLMEPLQCIATDFQGFVGECIDNDTHIPLLFVEAYKQLGIDAAPLIRHREKLARMREQEEEERNRKRQEEEERKAREEAEKEEKRLAQEKQNYMNGKSVAGYDFVTLCKNAGITIHIRTVGTLYKNNTTVSKDGSIFYTTMKGQRKPRYDGCFQYITQLNAALGIG